jgi:hypothetical protein
MQRHLAIISGSGSHHLPCHSFRLCRVNTTICPAIRPNNGLQTVQSGTNIEPSAEHHKYIRTQFPDIIQREALVRRVSKYIASQIEENGLQLSSAFPGANESS